MQMLQGNATMAVRRGKKNLPHSLHQFSRRRAQAGISWAILGYLYVSQQRLVNVKGANFWRLLQETYHAAQCCYTYDVTSL